VTGAAVNTSPLIFLARLGRLEALAPFRPLFTTDEVLREVKAGARKGFPEWVPVSRAVDEGFLDVHRADLRPIEGFILDPGELSVLRLAAKKALATVIVDDLAAIRAARHLGLSPKSTPFVLLENVAAGQLAAAEFRADLNRLLAEGYHLSAPLYGFLLEAVDRLPARP
jgi:predicted nucleic acid-binding protein